MLCPLGYLLVPEPEWFLTALQAGELSTIRNQSFGALFPIYKYSNMLKEELNAPFLGIHCSVWEALGSLSL